MFTNNILIIKFTMRRTSCLFLFIVQVKFRNEKEFILECLAYTQIRLHFQNISQNSDLHNLPSQQNHGDLGELLSMYF
jgi:hypothetical protein